MKNQKLWNLVDSYYNSFAKQKKYDQSEYKTLKSAFCYLLDNQDQFSYLYYWCFIGGYNNICYDKQFSKKFVSIIIKHDTEWKHFGILGYLENIPSEFNDNELIRYIFDLLIKNDNGIWLLSKIVERGLNKHFINVVSKQQIMEYNKKIMEYNKRL